MANKLTELADSLKKSLLSKNVADMAGDVLEVGFDHILADGIFKDLPLYNLIKGLYTFQTTIKNIHTANKIIRFISNLADIPYEERLAFIERIDECGGDQHIFETILIQLDRLDEAAKADMVANVFKLYLYGIIDQSLLLRITGVIDKAFINDLYALNQLHSRIKFYEKSEPPRRLQFLDIIRQNLFSLGLLDMTIGIDQRHRLQKDEPVKYALVYEINNLGYCVATAIRFDNTKIPLLKEHRKEIFKT